MGCVGLDPAWGNPPPWCWQAGVAPRPHSIGASKVGDAGVGTDTRAREGDDALGTDYPSGDRLDLPFAALFLGRVSAVKRTQIYLLDDRAIRVPLAYLNRDGDRFLTLRAV